MKVLALGATGAIGREILSNLPQACEIHVTSRKGAQNRDRIKFIQGDAKDDDFLQSVLKTDWDVILDFMAYETLDFNRRYRWLLSATGQYFLTSTGRVFAETDGDITEGSPRLLDVSRDKDYLATDEYALTKARQEDLLRDSGGNNWTIIRPYITFGEGRLQLGVFEKENWLYRALRGRQILFCSDILDRRTTMTDASDVARMAASLVGKPAALGEDFNLTGTKHYSWREVLETYSEVLTQHFGQQPDVAYLKANDFSETIFSTYQLIYDRMYDRRFNPSKISQFFDVEAISDPMPALRKRLLNQLSSDSVMRPNWRSEAKIDRAVRQRARFSEIASSRDALRYIVHRYIPTRVIQGIRSKLPISL